MAAGTRNRLHKPAEAITPRRSLRKGRSVNAQNEVPDAYQDLLYQEAAAETASVDTDARPLKKRRTGRREAGTSFNVRKTEAEQSEHDDDEDLEFEDVLGLENPNQSSSEDSDELSKPQQTAYRESDDDESASDFDWDTNYGEGFDVLHFTMRDNM